MSSGSNTNNNVVDIANDIPAVFSEKKIDYDYSKEQAEIDKEPNNADKIRYRSRFLALLKYYDRIVPVRSRNVCFSSELNAKLSGLPGGIKNQVERFKELFEKGEDVNNHLSKSVFDSNTLDYAFNLWGIKHFHLSEIDTPFEKAAMNNRSDWLLFVIIDKEAAYFVDVRKHPKGSGFTALSFFEIIARNGWMPLIEFLEVPGITGLCCDEEEIHTDDAIYELIKCSVNRLFKLENKYYFSVARTVMGSGDSYRIVDAINQFDRFIYGHPTWRYEELVETIYANGIAMKFVDSADEKRWLLAIELNNNESQIFTWEIK